ncbi:ABC transporter substrate-binding protein [Colwellia sp. E150_009]
MKLKFAHRYLLATVLFNVSFLMSLTVNANEYDSEYFNSIEHQQLMEASEKESDLLIYSNIAEYNWSKILDAFSAKYPWMRVNIQTLDMGPSAVFERYYAERSVNQKTADLIVTGSPDSWLRFVKKDGLLPYQSPLAAEYPQWSKPKKGLYTFSTDPMIMIYNKILLPENERPASLVDLMSWSSNPKRVNKIATYNADSHAFGHAIHWFTNKFFKEKNKDNVLYETLGSISRLENGGAIMVDKVITGEYLACYFVSGITVLPKMKQRGRNKILGWNLIKDGTPVFLRGMGVTQQARNPATAKLMLNYLLTHDGQVSVGKGGLTPYRESVTSAEVPYFTYTDIANEIGEENIIRVHYDSSDESEKEAFIDSWKQDYRIKN